MSLFGCNKCGKSVSNMPSICEYCGAQMSSLAAPQPSTRGDNALNRNRGCADIIIFVPLFIIFVGLMIFLVAGSR